MQNLPGNVNFKFKFRFAGKCKFAINANSDIQPIQSAPHTSSPQDYSIGEHHGCLLLTRFEFARRSNCAQDQRTGLPYRSFIHEVLAFLSAKVHYHSDFTFIFIVFVHHIDSAVASCAMVAYHWWDMTARLPFSGPALVACMCLSPLCS